MTRRSLVLPAAALAVVLAAVLAWLFQPWQLFTVTEVREALPTASTTPSPVPSSVPSGPVELARGTFVTYEHETTGVARLLRLPDASLTVRFEGLRTSNGPDVRVWLSDREATAAAGAGDGTWLELGPLKGNRGDLNYPVPQGVDVERFRSVVIWCKRFSVAFGAAPLAA